MMNQYKSWREKYGPWAVVTGASSGIGRGIAEELAARGMNVVLVARREAILQEMARKMQATYGIETAVVAADLAQIAGIEQVNQATADLDVGLLVASAGFGTSGRFLGSDLEQELNMLDVNCRALLIQTHLFAERFVARGRGGIVLLSSILGFWGTPNAAHYGATKAYVQTLVEGLYGELKEQNVDLLAAAPGPTHSGFAERAGMQLGGAMKAADLAKPILNALGRRRTELPLFLSKVLSYGLGMLPRGWRIKIIGNVMSGMTTAR